MIPESVRHILDQYSVEDIYEYVHERMIALPEDIQEDTETVSDEHEHDDEHDDEPHGEPDNYHEQLMTLVDKTIQEHADLFKEYKYITHLKNAVYRCLAEHETLLEVYSEDLLCEEIDIALHTLIGGYYPLRQTETYEHPLTNTQIASIQKQLTWIRDQPQPDQRTTEWYEFRNNLITASSAWKLLDTQAQRDSYIFGKCQPLNVAKYQRTSLESPFHWGQKYEPLSVLYYEFTYSTTIEEFGCIRHAHDHHMGASPDGINVDPKSNRYGRMLEIKNIVNREITGIPKKEYWIQMQLQMEVCQLDECDFLECRFKEYPSIIEFEQDGTWTITRDGHPKGAFLMFTHPDEPMPRYEYPPWNLTKSKWEQWEHTTLTRMETNGWEWVQTLYWKLPEVSCILVQRNPYWYQCVRDQFAKWWTVIEQERNTGYAHRESKKRRENREKREKQASNAPTKTPQMILSIFTEHL